MSHVIDEFSSSRGRIQLTSFVGKEFTHMIQITQGFGTKLGGDDEPGFIQLNPMDARMIIQALSKWIEDTQTNDHTTA